MAEFELVIIVLSFIVGFGVNEILSSFVTIARHPDRERVDWIAVAWAMAILVHQFQFWFGTLYVEQALGLSVSVFWLFILLAVLLYLAGGMILPPRRGGSQSSDGDDFDRTGSRALIPLTSYTAIAVIVNGATGLGWTQPPVTLNVVLSLLSLTALMTGRLPVRAAATITYLAVLFWGILFVWSRPGSILA